MPAENAPLVLYAGRAWLSTTTDCFAPAYPNAILVPLTEDAMLAIPDLSVAITPSAENGCTKPCWVVSHLVTTTSKARLRPTPSRITAEELGAIRRQIALAIGIDD